MKNIFSAILTAVLFSLLLFSCKPKIDLSLNLKEGKTYKQNVKIEIKGKGLGMNLNTTQIWDLSYFIKSVQKKDYDILINPENIQLTMLFMGDTIKASSSNINPSNPFSSSLSKLSKDTIGITISKTGKIIAFDKGNISNFINISTSKTEKIAEGTSKTEETSKVNHKISFGKNKNINNDMNILTSFYPSKPVSIGSKWCVDSPLFGKTGTTGKTRIIYTLSELTPDYAIIEGVSAIKSGNGLLSKIMPVKIEMNGSFNSRIKIDRKTGLIIEGKITQKTHGNLSKKNESASPDSSATPFGNMPKKFFGNMPNNMQMGSTFTITITSKK